MTPYLFTVHGYKVKGA